MWRLGACCLPSGTVLCSPECFCARCSPRSPFRSPCRSLEVHEGVERLCCVTVTQLQDVIPVAPFLRLVSEAFSAGTCGFIKLATLATTSPGWCGSTSGWFMGVQTRIRKRRDTTNNTNATLSGLKWHCRHKILRVSGLHTPEMRHKTYFYLKTLDLRVEGIWEQVFFIDLFIQIIPSPAR